MPSRPQFVLTGLAIVGLVLAAAGCSPGGGASATTGAAGSTAPASPAGNTASQSAPAGAASAAVNACAILPTQDVQAALGVSAVTATPVAGTACTYQAADGTPLAATLYTPFGGAQFDAFKAAPGAVQIPGVGDGAVIVNQTLYVKKGDAIFAVQLLATANLTPDKLQQIATTLGQAVAGHL